MGRSLGQTPSSGALSVWLFRLVIPSGAFVGRVVYREIVWPGRFDRMVRRIGLGFARHVGLSWRFRTVDVVLQSRRHRRQTIRICGRFQERSLR